MFWFICILPRWFQATFDSKRHLIPSDIRGILTLHVGLYSVVSSADCRNDSATKWQTSKLYYGKSKTYHKVWNDRGYVRFRNLISITPLPLLKEPPYKSSLFGALTSRPFLVRSGSNTWLASWSTSSLGLVNASFLTTGPVLVRSGLVLGACDFSLLLICFTPFYIVLN